MSVVILCSIESLALLLATTALWADRKGIGINGDAWVPQGGAASAGGLERGDRKGMQRTAKAKLIDVNEVRALQQQSHPQAPSASQASDYGGCS